MPDPNNLILPRHGIAFFGLAKNANTAIKRAFLQSLGIDAENVHDPALHDRARWRYASAADIAASDLWSFAIARDPWDRAASCWRDKCHAGWRPGWEAARLWRNMPFDAFCEVVAAMPDAACTGFRQHWRSQAWDLTVGGILVPDYIGRFEALADAWKTVRGHARRLLPDLSRSNGAEGPDPHTLRTRRLIAERYREDIEAFGYG